MDSTFIKLYEYHIGALERSLTLVYNKKCQIVQALHKNESVESAEFDLLKAINASHLIKEKFNTAREKLIMYLEREIIKVGNDDDDLFLKAILGNFLGSVRECSEMVDYCFGILIQREYVPPNIALSLLAFLSEHPVLDMDLIQKTNRQK